MKHYGDITKINGAEIEPVDVITAGSPCQDLSVAGKRAGLEGERSGLFMEQIRIIKEMREHDRRANHRTDEFIRPRYMVWENVPGALSSNKGEDFRCVLEETARIVQEDAVIPGPENGKWSYSGCIMGDGWTDIGDWTDSKGRVHKGDADSPRYKALGNSIALPFWFYLLRRISAQYERTATLGSLFDGIGGFPLCWEKCNGPGTAIWASEIEEFPIAVTKFHFGEE